MLIVSVYIVQQDEERKKAFRQFVNSDHTERGIPFIAMRGQSRPMDWPKDEFIPDLHEEGSKVSQPAISSTCRPAPLVTLSVDVG